MFDLEQAIANWRKQMLAAGIQTPVPLDELEIHLREDIEGQTKSDGNENKAFEAAVRKIGRGSALQTEFNKVASRQKIIRAGLLITGWLTAGILLLYFTLCLAINWDFMNFSLRWNQAAFVQIFVIAGVLSGLWFLAKASRDRVSRAGSLLVCLALVGLAVYYFCRLERFLSHSPSPFWFRGGLTLLVCLPAVFWVRWEWQRIIHKRDSVHKDQPVCSN